ncbi:MAG: hypothetical protein AAFZ58_10430, partial [Pseudomonadota bacterium]
MRILTSIAIGALALASIEATLANEPVLVRGDGSYPTVPLAKDEIVLKVVQNGVKNLQDYDDPRDGLAANLAI